MKALFIIILLLPATIMASGKKAKPAAISFHLQGSADEAPKFAYGVKTLAGEHYFRKVPEVSTKDITSFSPFPADDKQTYGIVFKLSSPATNRLKAVTSLHRGKLLLAQVNGKAMSVVNIDKTVSDGMLVIWSGIKLEEIQYYDQVAPRIGEDQKEWKKRLKKEKKKKKKQ